MLHTFSIQPGKKTVIGLKEDGAGGWQAAETTVIDFSPDDPDAQYNQLLAGFGNFAADAAGVADIAVIAPAAGVQNAQFTALNANVARAGVYNSDPDQANFPAQPASFSRDPDWVDRHSGNPALVPDRNAINLKNGNGTVNYNNENFQPMQREILNSNATQQRKYLFGYFRALNLPIRIYVKEYSGQNVNYWERVQIRLGWLGNDPKVDGNYQGHFTDPPLATNGEFLVGGAASSIAGSNTLERIEITAADLPAGADANHIHWIEIQGLNFPAASTDVTTGNGSDIWFKVVAEPGDPLPAKGHVNVQFLLDYSGSISTDTIKKDALRAAINEAVTEFNNLITLYNDPGLFRFSLRVVGAPGAARDVLYDAPEYKTYSEEDPSVLFTNSQLLVSFNDANTPNQILAQCNAILDDTNVRYAYSPIWRGVCESVEEFDLARDLTRTAASWPPATGTVPRDPGLDDINILIAFSDGEETIGGVMKDNDPQPDEVTTARREAAYLASQKLTLDAGLTGEAPGTLTEDQKGLLTSMISNFISKPVALTGEDLDVLQNAVLTYASHISPATGELPSFMKIDTTLSSGAIQVWNDIIAAQYRKLMGDIVSAAKSGAEPDAGTAPHRIWRLIHDFKIGGQHILVNSAGGVLTDDHPLLKMDSIVRDGTVAGWLGGEIRNSIINQRWCHLSCRTADV